MNDPDSLLALYDAQLRLWIPDNPPADVTYERTGPLLRVTGGHQGFVEAGRDIGVEGADLDALISEQVDFFRERDEAFEWKTRAHDIPTDVPAHLIAAGFEPEERETVVVAEISALARTLELDAAPPAGITIRRVTARADLDRIAEMESTVWSEDWSWLADDLESRLSVPDEEIVVLVAEHEDVVVSAAWLVTKPGRDFAGLWGGSTLEAWRGRGIYRALVAARAAVARDRGIPYLQVDASDDSRPILERLGFVAITTTTPYVWAPRA